MSLNDTVSAERVHIGFFGMRNAGKSSIVNAVTGQQLSVVSDVKGTTTDPVKKAMELLPLGPVVIIDTPGLDDEGYLGELRVKKAGEMLGKTDIAVLVVDSSVGMGEGDVKLKEKFENRGIPYITVYNKADLIEKRAFLNENEIYASAYTGEGIYELKEKLGEFAKRIKKDKVLISDFVNASDIFMLVTPVDESAPKGRLILPQQMTIRDILDHHGIVIACREGEVKTTLESMAVKPKMVITDSQVFAAVSKDVPEDIPLTSFSILMARYKGELGQQIKGASALSHLKEGDKVLISEGCTHHRQCNDIGAVKIPGWIEKFAGVKPKFTFTSGGEFPEDLSEYALAVHCGGCMLNETEMKNRIKRCSDASVPVVNYGVAIAHMNGILKRSISMFDGAADITE